jgi:two-component system, chemotaxis family, protein-glutamate methylesterase/glutaminase
MLASNLKLTHRKATLLEMMKDKPMASATDNIKILIVDDSIAVRRILQEILSSEACFEILTAPSGRVALSKIAEYKPALVTLDIEMPDMNGLETLKNIRRLYPKLPVIMVSALTEKGAQVTLDALALGASDYIAKPGCTSSQGQALAELHRELIAKIFTHCPQLKVSTPSLMPVRGVTPGSRALEKAPLPRVRVNTSPVEIVVMGISTGGPNALMEMLPKIPATFPVPIVVVQHMPATFTRLLAERLHSVCPLAVREASPSERVVPGTIWLAPGDFHLLLHREEQEVLTCVEQGAPENSCRPAADVLFRSAAQAYGAGVLAVVMTGMGHDGMKGCHKIREAGGRIIAQDEATSVVWGMPGAVVKAKLADAIVPLHEIADLLQLWARQGRRRLPNEGRPSE